MCFVLPDDSTIKKKVVLILVVAHHSIVWCGIVSLENLKKNELIFLNIKDFNLYKSGRNARLGNRY